MSSTNTKVSTPKEIRSNDHNSARIKVTTNKNSSQTKQK